MKNTKKGQGSKLNRTEILQFRLDPKLRFALELMARSERRTVSSFIEKLVSDAIDTHSIVMLKTFEELRQEKGKITTDDISGKDPNVKKTVTLTEALKQLWHVDEIHRFILMAFYSSSLLAYDEELMWHFIMHTNYYWTYYYVNANDTQNKSLGKMLTRIFDPKGVLWERLEMHWPLLKAGQGDKINELLKNEDGSVKQGKIISRPDDEPEEITLMRHPSGMIGVEKIE
jgi:hypothetical protein